MTCCNWQTFEGGFIAAWRKAAHSPSELLIDWKVARRDWRRYHCTGNEAARMQIDKLLHEGLYCIEPPKRGSGSCKMKA